MQKSDLIDTVKEGVRGAVLEGLAEEDGEVIESIDVEEDEISAADALIDEIRGEEETTVNVYRIGAGRGKETFLFAASPEDITAKDIMERCRDQHAGGDFKMVTRDAKRIVKSARFSVEAVAAGIEPETKSDGIGTAELIALMNNNTTQLVGMFQSSMAAMAEAIKGSGQPTFNPNEATKTIMESVAAMKSLTDAPRDTSGKDMVAMLVQGVELAAKLNAKDGETNSFDLLGKAMEYLPALADAAKANPAGVPLPGQKLPGQPGPHPDPATQASIEREHKQAVDKEREKQTWAMNIAMLLGWAKQGKDPLLYAELILDQVGEEKTLQYLDRPDALEFLASFNPEVLTYRGWFEALKKEILELTAPDPADDTSIEGEILPAEDSNVQHDAEINGNASSAPGRNGGSS